MKIEHQRFMAFEGIQSWAGATIVQVQRIEATLKARLRVDEGSANAGRQFQAERHLFLIAAFKLVQHIEWAKKLDFLDNAVFAEIESLSAEIKTMRDLNEHVVEYFIAKGRFPDQWTHIDEGSIADASSTVDDRIGNRLSWRSVAAAAETLITQLPANYFPTQA